MPAQSAPESQTLQVAHLSELERLNYEVDKMAVPQRLSDHVVVSLQDSWTILGVKGSGKTTFARNWMPAMNIEYPGVRNYILDSKGYGEFDDFAALPGAQLVMDATAPMTLTEAGGIQIWKPPLNNPVEYNNWFGSILRDQKPCIILIDELASLAVGRRSVAFPDNYILLLKQGRIMEESVVSMTQEMAYIDRNVFGQMTHFLRFFLINKFDLRESNSLMGMSDRDRYRNPSNEHGFFYRRMDKPTWPTYEYTGWQEFLQRS